MTLCETLCGRLGIDDEKTLWAMTATGYKRVYIPKPDGGKRALSVPKRPLRLIQNALSKYLEATLKVHSAAHGFVRGRSILTAAQIHLMPAMLVNFDLADWYGHITRSKLHVALACSFDNGDVNFILHASTAPPRFGMEPCLPQGAPTSPVLANASAWDLDERLAHLFVNKAHEQVWRYTRFADDLTFSCPTSLGRKAVKWLVDRVKSCVRLEGYELVAAKRVLARPHQAQRVQGLVVNSQGGETAPRLPREYHRRLRAALRNRAVGHADRPWNDDQLRGAIAFVEMVEPRRGAEYLAEFEKERR